MWWRVTPRLPPGKPPGLPIIKEDVGNYPKETAKSRLGSDLTSYQKVKPF
jgi:hypothetical protein